ncbi:MAG: 16S rRNA (guanine(527)-N(7))-methyltransferase RsmG [Pseudomonadota bacterium]
MADPTRPEREDQQTAEAAARDALAARSDVSRETMARLDRFAELLAAWTTRINLVSRADRTQIWRRHILDSARLLRFATPAVAGGLWLDLGSGGGFPGLVVAAHAAEAAPGLRFELVESDHRKAAFLTTAAAEMGLAAVVRVSATRIETLPPREAGIVSARALASLPILVRRATPHLAADGRLLLLKGSRVGVELDAIAKIKGLRYQLIAEAGPGASNMLVVEGISRVGYA